MKVPQVGEIMSPLLLSLRTDRTLEEARAFLREHNVGAAPVLTPGGSFVGVVTEFQLLKCFLKRNTQTPEMKILGNYLTELAGAHSVTEFESATTAFKELMLSASRRVYVTDRDGRLIGVLEPTNFFQMLAPESEGEVRPRMKRLRADGSDMPASIEEQSFKFTPCPLIGMDLSGQVVSGNPALHVLLEYRNGELIGKTFKSIFPEPHHEEVQAILAKIRDSGFHGPVNIAFAKKDQTLVKVDLVTALRKDEKDNPAGVVMAGWLHEPAETVEFLKVLMSSING